MAPTRQYVTIRPVPTSDHIPDVLVVCPGQRDRLNLADERILERFAVQLAGEPIRPGFDATGFIDHMAAVRAGGRRRDGVERRHGPSGRRARRAPGACPARAGPRSCAATTSSRRAGSRPRRCRARRPRSLRSISTRPKGHAAAAVSLLPEACSRHTSPSSRTRSTRMPSTRQRSPRPAPTSTRSPRTTGALEGRTFRTLVAEELLDGLLVTFEGFMCGGRDDTDRRDRRRDAPERDQLPAFRVPERPPPRCTRAMAEVAARLMPALRSTIALQHRVLRPPRRDR